MLSVSLLAFIFAAVALAIAKGADSCGDTNPRLHGLVVAHSIVGLVTFCCPLCFIAYRESTESVLVDPTA